VTAHNTIIRKLLFEAATFHGLAKLRLHTETTVTDLEHSLTRFGDILRTFHKTVCPAYKTSELPSEEAARIRRQASAAKKNAASEKGKAKATPVNLNQGSGRRQRDFKLDTYKIHALGGYAKAIRKYGSMDNYNTQSVRYFIFLMFIFTVLSWLPG
jgi:hypothetical protein